MPSNLPIKDLALVLDAAETAMQEEGVAAEVIERVRNRIIWGHPEGGNAVVRITPEEVLARL